MSKTVSAVAGMLLICSCFGGLVPSANAQYPGLITKKDKPEPVLRSVAVLEWTGEAGKPSASRVIPVSVYDGEQLNDGTIYLDRPEPLALAGGVEYELQTEGKPTGIFDVFGAGNVDGSWQGVGVWKPLTPTETKKAAGAFNTSSMMNGGVDIPEDDDKPVLHRKHPKGTDTDDGGTSSTAASTASGTAGSGSTTSKSSDSSTANGDPDRPKLKRKAGDDSSTGSGSGTGTSSSDTAKSVDPDRPTIRKARHAEEADLDSSRTAPDPDRPRLRHGKPDNKTTESPRLEGLPPTMQQAVAVSDARSATEHPWKYKWANADDANKMKTAIEAIARTELGMDAPAAGTAEKSAGAKSTGSKAAGATSATAKTATATGPVRRKNSMLAASSEPVALTDEKFAVFELTYGSTATMVLTASTPAPAESAGPTAVGAGSGSAGSSSANSNTDAQDGPPVIKRGKPTSNTAGPIPAPAPQSGAKSKAAAMPAKPAVQKFVTIIAQPDLYGGVKVLYKYVTDAAHLDERPRMRLVDAVDAMGDNRGELLFELRGQTQRQFAMYRVMRGTAEQLFATGPAATVAVGTEVN